MATSRRLVIEFIGDTSSLEKATGRVKGESDKAGKGLGGLSTAAKTAGFALGAGLAVAAKAGFGELAEGQKVTAQTQAVLKSTGGAAKITSSEVEKLAGAISRKSGIDDEAIQSGENLLLTFTGIRNEAGKGNDIFNQTTQAAADMATAMGTDVKTAAMSLGKALNDPAAGLSKLTKQGVTFTDAQKDQIKAMVASGDTMGAQKIVLAELQKEFGGSAEAAGKTFPGQLSKLRNSFEDVAGGLVSALLPALESLAKIAAEVGSFLQEHPKLAKILGLALVGLTATLLGVNLAMKASAAITALMTGAQAALNAVMAANPFVLIALALAALAAGFVVAYRESETFRNIVNTVWDALKIGAAAVVGFFREFDKIPAKMKAAGQGILQGLVAGIKALPGLLVTAAGWVLSHIDDAIKAHASAYLTVGKWLLGKVADGIKLLPGLLVTAAGWVLSHIDDAIKAHASAYLTVGKWLLGRMIDGVRAALSGLAAVGGWVLEKVRSGLTSIGESVLQGARTIGQKIIDGVLSGLGGLFAALKSKLESTLKGVLESLNPFSPVEHGGEKYIGKPLAEGALKGWVTGSAALPQALSDSITAAVERARTTIESKRGAFNTAWGSLASGALSAFDKMFAGQETPAEHQLRIWQDNIAQIDRMNTLAEAKKGLTAATTAGDPQAILAAKKAVLDAETAITMAALQKRAADERLQLNAEIALKRTHFESRLTALQTSLATEGASQATAHKRVMKLFASFGVDYETAGMVLGDAFVSGLAESLLKVEKIAAAIKSFLSDTKLKAKKGGKGDPGGSVPSILQGTGGSGSITGGTLAQAGKVASMFGLHVTSGYRTPQHNAAVGGVPNSLHTHGSPGNPGAIDLAGPVSKMYQAQAWARSHMKLAELLVHDVGSGLHLHLGFFEKGGMVGRSGPYVVGESGPEIVNLRRGSRVTPNHELAGGALVHIEHAQIGSHLEARSFAERLAFRIATTG